MKLHLLFEVSKIEKLKKEKGKKLSWYRKIRNPNNTEEHLEEYVNKLPFVLGAGLKNASEGTIIDNVRKTDSGYVYPAETKGISWWYHQKDTHPDKPKKKIKKS